MNPIERPYVIKTNNAGMVPTTGGNDLLHTLAVAQFPGGGARSAVITKIMCWSAVAGTLLFGTLNRAAAPAFVQLIPTLIVGAAIDNEWAEEDLPAFEFMSWPQLTAAGRLGDIYVFASAAAMLILLELKEYGG